MTDPTRNEWWHCENCGLVLLQDMPREIHGVPVVGVAHDCGAVMRRTREPDLPSAMTDLGRDL